MTESKSKDSSLWSIFLRISPNRLVFLWITPFWLLTTKITSFVLFILFIACSFLLCIPRFRNCFLILFFPFLCWTISQLFFLILWWNKFLFLFSIFYFFLRTRLFIFFLWGQIFFAFATFILCLFAKITHIILIYIITGWYFRVILFVLFSFSKELSFI